MSTVVPGADAEVERLADRAAPLQSEPLVVVPASRFRSGGSGVWCAPRAGALVVA